MNCSATIKHNAGRVLYQMSGGTRLSEKPTEMKGGNSCYNKWNILQGGNVTELQKWNGLINTARQWLPVRTVTRKEPPLN